MADDTVNVQIVATDDGLRAGLQRASDAVSNLTPEMGDASTAAEGFGGALERIGEIAAGVFTADFIVGALEKISEEFKSVSTGAAEWGEHIKNLATETGITTTHLQELEFATKATGTSFEGLVQFSGRLSRALLTLETGASKQLTSVLATAGLKPADLEDTYTAIVKISEAINRLGPGSAEANALLTTLGGRGALRLEPALAQLREFTDEMHRLGLTLDSETVAQLAHAEEQFNILGAVVDVAKERIGAALVPVMESAARILIDLAEQVNILAQTGVLNEWAVRVANGMIDGAEAVLKMVQQLDHLTHGLFQTAYGFEAFFDASTLQFGKATAAFKAALEENASFIDQTTAGSIEGLEKLRIKLNETSGGLQTRIVGPEKPPGHGGGFAPAVAGQAADDHQKQLDEQFRMFAAEQNREVAQAGNTATAKIAAYQAELEWLTTHQEAGTLQFIELQTREIDEVNRANAEKNRLNEAADRAWKKRSDQAGPRLRRRAETNGQ